MRKIISSVLAVLLALSVFPLFASAANPPEIAAKAAIVAEKTTGTVLYELNADEKLYPASLTKIMTAILALEHCSDVNETVTVSSKAIKPLDDEKIHTYLLPNEQISFMSLLEYLLIPSGNDAANALAIHTSGSVEEFVELMNQKAAELGLTGTHFTNAHGLHDENHYTTARDVLILSEYAMENQVFAETVAKNRMTLPATNKHSKETILNTTNYLLSQNSDPQYTYPGVIGIKTGSTTPAGLCLSSALVKDGMEYYCVVLGCTTDADGKKGQFVSSSKLLDYVTKNFSMQTMLLETKPIVEVPVTLSPDGESVILLPSESLSALLPNDFSEEDLVLTYDVPEALEAPIEKGDRVGSLTVSYQDKVYGEIGLVSSSSFTRSQMMDTVNSLQTFVQGTTFKIIVVAVLAIFILLIVIIIVAARSRRSKRRRYGSPGRYRR